MTMPDGSCILTINGGSSSIKFALFDLSSPLRKIASGALERIGQLNAGLSIKGLAGMTDLSRPVAATDHVVAVGLLIAAIEELGLRDTIVAIGHRVVHGGPSFSEPDKITADMMATLRTFTPFDPEHLPEEILLIETLQQHFPDILQIACFDTAFHHGLPRVAKILPIPRRFEAKGVRRYGFHGLSYAFVLEELARLDGQDGAHGRLILAHLGNGASLAAVRGRRPVDTSMSFTPASGVMMGTRTGDIDPGLVSYFARTENMSPAQFDALANFESGLLGVSETSSDMQSLLECEATDVRAAEAISVFCYQIKKCIGAFAAVLGGVDTLVFTGGIGENSPAVRTRICEGLDFLGIALEPSRNAKNATLSSSDASRGKIRIIQTDEERMIAQFVASVLGVASADNDRLAHA